MAKLLGFVVLVSLGIVQQTCGHGDAGPSLITTLDVKMPGARPAYNDQYLCASVPVEAGYVVGYKPMADATKAHHILLFGCTKPFKFNGIWECGSTCAPRSRRSIMFAWAKNAPPLKLPEDVGFQVGDDSGVNYIVIQVHYAHKFDANAPKDTSGIQLQITKDRQKYKAGIFLLAGSWQTIPPHMPVVHVDVSCKFSSSATIYPFGFRTHAHSLSRVITGYLNNGTWFELGKGNPQWPQAFYPMKEKFAIHQGDSLVARCTYNSTNMNHTVSMGSTANDEMCNFYMMYYTDADTGITFDTCAGNRLPNLVTHIPADSDKPLPPNPLLDEIAKGHHHHAPQGEKTHEEVDGGKHDFVPVDSSEDGDDKIVPGNMDYYNSEPSQDYESYSDYVLPQKYDNSDSDYLGNFYRRTENDRSRNRNRYPDFHKSEEEVLSGQYPQMTGSARSRSGDGINRWGSVSAKKGPGPRLRPRPPTISPPPPPTHVKPSSPNHAQRQRVKTPANPPTKLHPVPAQKSGMSPSSGETTWVHVPTTMTLARGWPQTQNFTVGQVGGLATDKDGCLYIFHRAKRIWDGSSFNVVNVFQHQDEAIPDNTLMKLDRNGKILKQWGSKQFYMPHGLEVDDAGNIWLTDVAMHQVFRYPPNSEKPDLTLGVLFVPGIDDKHFCKPADVAVLSTGEFFIADGYCNARLMKFSKDGKLINKWGSPSVGEPAQRDHFPPTNTFQIVHSVTVAEDKDLVCAADRENGRIQCYDLNGIFKKQIHNPRFGSKVFAVEYCPLHGGVLFAINGPSPYYPLPAGKKVIAQGFTINIDTGDIIGSWQPGDAQQGFHFPHDVAVHSAHHEVYVGEIDPYAVWKFVQKSLPTGGTVETVKKDELPSGQHDKPASGGEQEPDPKASIIIGTLLIVPIAFMVVITILVRLHSKGKLQCCNSKPGRAQVFNLGNYFNSHKGFDPLSTEESDHEIDPLNDSDEENYSTTLKA